MRTTILLLVAACGFAAASGAQKPAAPPPAPPGPPPEVLDTTGFGLTADQTAKFKVIVAQLQQQNDPLRAQLRQIIGGKSFQARTPAERDAVRAQIEPIRLQIIANRRKAHEQIQALLTPVQRTKLEGRMKGQGPPN